MNNHGRYATWAASIQFQYNCSQETAIQIAAICVNEFDTWGNPITRHHLTGRPKLRAQRAYWDGVVQHLKRIEPEAYVAYMAGKMPDEI